MSTSRRRRRPSLKTPRRRHGRRRSSHAPGLPPGTLIVGPDASELSIRLLRWDEKRFEELEVASVDALEAELGRAATTWVDVVGFGDAERLTRLGTILGLHPLALEDVANTNQRPKVETFGGDLLVFARLAESEPVRGRPLETEQLGLLVRPGLVVTFQEHPGDCFEPVRQRLRAGNPRIRRHGAGYLAYALLDALVDHYVLLVDGYRTALEDLEEELLEDLGEVDLHGLHRIRRDLIRLGRLATPLRDVVGQLLREPENRLLDAEMMVFLRDCHDHAIRTVDRVDAYRDFAASLMEVYVSMVGHRTNEVMKVLTLIATIFIPLSFLAGLYGMNFDTSSPWNMPELSWRYGYPALLGVMAAVAVALLAYFKRRDWL